MAKVRDLVSGLTHCIGAGLSLVAMVLLIVFSSIWGNAYHIVSFTIFGVALFLLYLFSTLYHWLNVSEKAITVFRKFDHIMIYIFIAASYTPVCLIPLRGPWGWSIFGVIWGLAIAGTLLSALWIKAPRAITTSIYIAMGWAIVIAIFPLIGVFKELNMLTSLWWLLAGGIFYTMGGLIYGFKWPKINFKHFGFHEIFHVFVMLGSACHFWFIFYHLLQIQ